MWQLIYNLNHVFHFSIITFITTRFYFVKYNSRKILNSTKLVSSHYFDFENVHMNVSVIRFVIEMICRINHTNRFSLQHAISDVCLGRQTVQMPDRSTYICGLLKIKNK